MRQISPKILAGLAIVLSLGFAISQLFVLWQAGKEFREIHSVHLPIIELYSTKLRLNETSNHSLKLAVLTKNKSWLEDYLLVQEALNEYLKSYQSLLDSNKEYQLSPIDADSSETLHEIEAQIVQLINAEKYESALQLLESKDYKAERDKMTLQLQAVVERLSADRDETSTYFSNKLNMNVAYSIIFILLVIILWWTSLQAFQRNARQRRIAEKTLELERLKSFQSSKLASLGEMAGGIAHEINNPLAIINGYAQSIEALLDQDKLNPEKLKHYASRISSTSFRVAQIVQSLRKLSRDGSKEPITIHLLNEIITDTLELCQQRFVNSGIALEIGSYPTDTSVLCRPVQISQVILNLLNNAFDAASSASDPKVRLGFSIKANQIYIEVSDNGSGIDQKIKDRILEPFFTTKEVGKGTGLGLSVSKKIIEDHGGQLEFSRSDGWTHFWISLQCQPQNHEEGSHELHA